MAKEYFLTRFARWALSLDANSIPAPVIEKTKLLLLDTVGCGITGSRARVASGTLKTVQQLGGAPQASLIGHKEKTSAVNAVLANTVFIRSLEINDIMGNDPNDGSKLGGHPSDNVSAVFAFGEMAKASGKEALANIVLAYEIFGRAQRLLERGMPWDHTSAHAFASGAVAGRLLGLTELQLANALGLVAAHCPIFNTVRRGEISDAKFMASAFGAQLGAQSAVLARNGVTGPVGTLEDPDKQFKNAINPNRDEEEWIKPFGKSKYMIEGVTIKAYPSLDTGQALVEAAAQMSKKIGGKTDDIEKIDITMTDIPMVVHQIEDKGRRSPKLQAAATHSFYFLPCVTLIDGVLTPNTFEQGERWLDPKVNALMDKVSIGVDAAWLKKAPGGMPCTIKLTLKGGKTEVVEVPYAPGHQYNMMTTQQVLDKMANNTGKLTNPKFRSDILAMVNKLDQPGVGITNLIDMLRF
jgi:2-methylcitrate dehydratase